MSLVNNFLEEYKKWHEAGSPVRSPEKIEELFIICSSNICENYEPIKDGRGKCGVCGCNLKRKGRIMNKLSWATTKCPLIPPLWEEEITEEKANAEEKKGGCGC
jgi:hypothetical protein